MLFDGIQLVEGSDIKNASIATGASFPGSPSDGELFFVNSTTGGNAEGLYVYNLQITSWVRLNQQGDTAADILPQNTTPGTYRSVTVTDTGLVTSGTNPTTLSGYGITDAQPLDADLTAIAALVGTTGLLKKTASNTWGLDTSTYLTNNQNITFSGDVSGSGSTNVTLTLSNSGVAAGTYGSANAVSSVTFDSNGRATNAQQISIAIDTSAVTSGSFADSRISQSSVTQYQSAFSIAESQIPASTILARKAVNETISGTWTFTHPISGVTPSANSDLATKGYVDTTISSNTVSFATLSGKPTTLSGYGITDALNRNGDTLAGNLAATSGTKFTMADAPVNGIDLTNKNYVDSAIAGLSWKNAVRAIATSNIALSGTQTIDDVVLATGDRILVAGQTTAAQNGIYVVSSGAWSRASDADSANEIESLAVFVKEGTVNADSGWTCTSQNIVLGTSPIVFVQFNGAQGITAGIGLLKTGNVLDVNLGAGISQLPTDEVGVDLYPAGGLMLTVDGSASSTNSAAQLALTNTGVSAGTSGSGSQIPVVTVDTKGRVTSISTTANTPSFANITSKPTTIAGYGITDAQPKLTGTGLVRSTAGAITYDTSTYLTANQNISVTGDATGSGTTSIALTLANSGVTAGTYGSNSSALTLTVDAKGRVTSVATNPIAAAFVNITGKPTTLSGYGITDAQGLNANLTSLAALSNASTGIVKFTAGVASIDSGTYLTSNQTVTITGDATGSGTTSIALTLANSGATPGTFGSSISTPVFTVDAKGRVTSSSGVQIAPPFANITSKPTTIAGYGITDAVSTSILNSTAQNITWKNAVKAASTADITSLFGTMTIDGVALVSGDRVLVKDQYGPVYNGIYIVSAGAWTRATDFDTAAKIYGANVYVRQGTVNGNCSFGMNNDALVTVDSDAITFIPLTGAVTLVGTANQITVSSTAGKSTFALAPTITGLTSVTSTSFFGTLTGSASSATTANRANNIAGGTVGAISYQTGTNTSAFLAAGTAGQVLTSAGAAAPTWSNPSWSSLTGTPTTLAGYGITDGATQSYVDAAVTGLSWKTSVKAATTANIALSGPQTIDGISVIAGDRVLVKNQSTASQNGIYVVAAGAWTRATDSDTATEIDGSAVYVRTGTTVGDTSWVESGTVTTLGTDAVTYVQFAGSGQTITLTGDVTGSGATSIALTLANSGATAGTYSKVTVDAKGRVTTGANIVSTDVTTALGFTPYNATNPNGYTNNVGTVTNFVFTNGSGFTGIVNTAGTTPTLSLTLQNATTSQSGQLTNTDWNTFNNKQASLVSGTNIKTVGGISLLGSGDIPISGSYLPLSGGTLSGNLNVSGNVQSSNAVALASNTNSTCEVIAGANDFFSAQSWSAALLRYHGSAYAGNWGGSIPLASSGMLMFQNVSSGIVTSNSAPIWIGATSQPTIYLPSFSGRVGINQSNPTCTLDVNGTLQAGNITSTGLTARSVATAISASGSTQASATALTSEINVVTTVTSGTGVALPGTIGVCTVVWNNGANPLTVYPNGSTGIIDYGSAGAGVVLPVGARIMFIAVSATQYITLNASYA